MNGSKTNFRFIAFLLKIVVIIAAIGGGVYLVNRLYLQPMRERERMIENLQLIVSELTRDRRIAEVSVTEQSRDPLTTTFRFTEVDEEGNALAPPQEFTIAGDIAYFDTLVIKFEDSYMPLEKLPLDQEILRSHLARKAIIFFRRVFSEKQKPEDGFPIDTPGNPPVVYSTGKGPTPFTELLWRDFWEMANNTKLAESRGVRAAHGQAVYTKLLPGRRYVLEQRLTGDLTIRPMDMPASRKSVEWDYSN
jgi:hypothetical protein